MLAPARLVVADVDKQGQSIIAVDGEVGKQLENQDWPGAGVTMLWRSPAAAHEPPELWGEPPPIEPPVGGTTFMIWSCPSSSELARMDPERRARAERSRIATVGKALHSLHLAMHATATLDYVIVLRGEITLIIVEGGEVTLGPGDAVADRGARHAWENRGMETALCAVVNIDAPAWANARSV